MKVKLQTLVIILLIGGCSSSSTNAGPGENTIWREGSDQWFRSVPQAEITEYFTRKCEAYGFVRGDLQMAQCIQSEINATRQREALR